LICQTIFQKAYLIHSSNILFIVQIEVSLLRNGLIILVMEEGNGRKNTRLAVEAHLQNPVRHAKS